MTEEELKTAQDHGRDNREEIVASRTCGCFYCLGLFTPASIERWLNEESGTAVCPLCQIDSVIGDASGYPVESPQFLAEMHWRWFESSVPVEGSVG